jgi:protein-S-isoprenylcysteine O-methyltransferase Ste14
MQTLNTSIPPGMANVKQEEQRMIESLSVTLFPVVFLILLFGGGTLFRRRNIDMDGEPPIEKTIFYTSKYAIVLIWAVMALQSCGINLSLITVPTVMKSIALTLWFSGFILLFIGRFGLGESFRIGSPKESTSLQVNGLFKFSRNPMYLGVFGTLIASMLYTLNPFLILIGIFVIVVHHKIVLAEEQYLQKNFGEQYTEYCHRVRRYF